MLQSHQELHLEKGKFYLLIARLEPENNIETILDGFAASATTDSFIVVGDFRTKYGKYLVAKYKTVRDKICFAGSIYDKTKIDALRYFCKIYFHGHSVGGTNPSLLEAMAAKSFIIAHDNRFNRTVLGAGNLFFKNSGQVKDYIQNCNAANPLREKCIQANLEKIDQYYQWQIVIDDYEKLFLKIINS